MPNHILFDLDGTLTNPQVGITKSVEYALNHFGIKVSDLENLIKFIGPPLRESFQLFYGFDEVSAELAVAKYREYFAETGIFENEIYEGMEDLLQTQINRGRQLIVATSKPTVYAEQIVSHFNLDRFFGLVVGSELDGQRSKKAEVIRLALDRLNLTGSKKIIMIGDREYDVIGAREMGLECIGVLYGFGSCSELVAAGATHIVASVAELGKLLLTV